MTISLFDFFADLLNFSIAIVNDDKVRYIPCDTWPCEHEPRYAMHHALAIRHISFSTCFTTHNIRYMLLATRHVAGRP